jgi:hypothetical protein
LKARDALTRAIEQMNKVTRIGFVAVAAETIFASTVSAIANEDASELSNPFTKHGLPIPGVYFSSKEKAQPATIAVGKSGVISAENRQYRTQRDRNRS